MTSPTDSQHCCPHCNRHFKSSDATLKHLQNEQSGPCHEWFISRFAATESSPSRPSAPVSPSRSGSSSPSPSASTASSDPRRRLDARLREFMKDGETTDVPSSDLSDTDSDTSDETGLKTKMMKTKGSPCFSVAQGRTSVRAQTF